MLLQMALFRTFLCQSSIPSHVCATSLTIQHSGTFRLLSCLGYCKQCGSEHWGACILSRHMCPRPGLLDHNVALFFFFLRILHIASLQWSMPIYIPTNDVGGFPFLYTLSSIYLLQIFKIMVIDPKGYKQ